VGAIAVKRGLACKRAEREKQMSPAQQQALQGRVPLSQGAMIAATTSSGTGGGSGGGSGSCLRAGMVVQTKERGTGQD
jgi:hypothetical protein